jgi:DNA polymerase zeta
VAHISLVKGVPFFGYHVGYKFFLKIYLHNPSNMTRLADLLIQGAVLARIFQPHESHMQYLAQWMCDYNLFGCGYIDCEKVRFRGPLPEFEDMSDGAHKWHDRCVSEDSILREEDFPRQSHCSLEIDICIQDIMNRRETKPRLLHHDFLERFHELGPDEKFVHSMAGLWKDETKRRKKKMGLVDPGSSPFPPEVLVSMSAELRAEKGNWIHEEEYRELMDILIDQEKKTSGGEDVSFEHFVHTQNNEVQIQTAIESIADLYPENLLKHDETVAATPNRAPGDPALSILVNTESISQAPDEEDDGYHSDEDAAREMAMSQKESPSEYLTKQHDGRPEDKESRDDLPEYDDEEQSSGNMQHNRSLDTNKRKPETHAGPFSSYHRSVRRKVSQNEELFEEINTIRKRKLYELTPFEQAKGNGASISVTPGSINTGKTSTPRRVTFQNAPSNTPVSGSNESSDVVGGVPQASSQLSQGSINARGPTTLAFPVVKKPHDPDTELRLSQRSEYSNSQTLRTPASKQVTFTTSKRTPITPWTIQKSVSSGPSPVNNKLPSQLLKATSQLKAAFNLSTTSRVRCLAAPPPTVEEVSSTIAEYDLPPAIFQDAYYSDERDVPERPREYAGKEFKLESNTLPFLPDFDPTATSLATAGEKPPVVRDRNKEDTIAMRRSRQCTLRNWELVASPPTADEVEQWLVDERKASGDHKKSSKSTKVFKKELQAEMDFSQIDGPTQKNNGYKYSQKQTSTGVEHETQYMSIMSLEVHVNTRGSLAPNPEEDRVECIFWCVETDDGKTGNKYEKGILTLSSEDGISRHIARTVGPDVYVEYEEDELEMLNKMIDIVRHHDPDILTGYEVHNGSWGYLMERARLKYEFNISDEFSRMKSQSHGRFGKQADRWGFEKTSSIRVTGRHMINVWRAMRGELNLLQYTMENVVFHILHKRIPHYTHTDLTRWYNSGKFRNLAKTINYFLSRTQLNLQILESNELIARTSEQARLLGVDFFSVFSRGSQFKVESLMFRIAKPENYILVSPSRKQVGMQNALECLPLVMEPQSAFYSSPVLVLDFQSLYPSVMIAYNYCYSTCLGRVVSWRGKNKMGFTDFKREPRLLELVKDHVNIAPNGLMYVRPEMRKSLLAKMLSEILETRVMVKSGMKQDKDDKTLQHLLNNRQLALKLIANVTYGYTSASFSGRMPCSEIADSIVQTGRETLEKAIAMIHSVSRWGAEVVYGDTDSLFVSLKGRTKDQAFQIGKEIADAITNANPRPVKLKFEKVYHPCVLLAKKRYVGFKYESPNQKEPEFDAKGIETVRRDGTPAEQKIEEKALKILFRTQDLSEIKRYFQSQCTKIMMGRVSIQDFLFAKEVRLGSYSDKGLPPPGAMIATKRMLEDPRKEPQYGERVPYVVITGAPGARLIDRCVDPEVLLKDDQIELDAEYYISKNLIPPLERIFNLVGANVRSWYDEMPKIQRIRAVRTTNAITKTTTGTGISKKTLESYLQSTVCLVCRSKLPAPPPANATTTIDPPPLPICEECVANPAAALYALRMRLHRAESRVKNVHDVCQSCSGLSFGDEIRCDSRDCPVFYTRVRENAALGSLKASVGGVVEILEAMELDPKMDW